MKEEIENGIDVNCKGAQDRTALHRACGAGHVDIVHALLDEFRADLGAVDKLGRNALHWAATGTEPSCVQCAEILVNKGIDINAVTKSGTTALHIACDKGNVPFVKFLAAAGCNQAAKDSQGRTPVDIAKVKKLTAVVEALDPQASKEGCIIS